jgi:LPP20 lipoprotein
MKPHQRMVTALTLLATIGLTGCKTTPTHSSPQRVTTASHCLQAPNLPSLVYRGYGAGHSLREAKLQAYRDIAEQLHVDVRSYSEINQRKENNQVSSEFKARIESYSQKTFQALEIDCLDKQATDGNIHVALLYDARPQITRNARALLKTLAGKPNRLEITGPKALTHSQLVEDFTNAVTSPNGYGPLMTDISIERIDNRWHIFTAKQTFTVEDHQLNYAINWQALNKEDISLTPISIKGKPLPTQITNETEYRWQIKSPTSGYLHLLGFYQTGELDIIRQDIKVSANQTLIIPENGGVFETGLIAPNKPTVDTYFAIVTEYPFQQTKLTQFSSQKNLGNMGQTEKLLSWIEQSQHQVSLVILSVEI